MGTQCSWKPAPKQLQQAGKMQCHQNYAESEGEADSLAVDAAPPSHPPPPSIPPTQAGGRTKLRGNCHRGLPPSLLSHMAALSKQLWGTREGVAATTWASPHAHKLRPGLARQQEDKTQRRSHRPSSFAAGQFLKRWRRKISLLMAM